MNKSWLVFVTVLIISILGILVLNHFYPLLPTFQNSADSTQNSPLEVSSASASPTVTVLPSRYIEYSAETFRKTPDKKRVYFFYASWCPTCRPADAQFSARKDEIPEDVVLFKTDYDSETELKKQYDITYQHTYVLVDSAGTEIKKWNGGGIEELINNTQD